MGVHSDVTLSELVSAWDQHKVGQLLEERDVYSFNSRVAIEAHRKHLSHDETTCKKFDLIVQKARGQSERPQYDDYDDDHHCVRVQISVHKNEESIPLDQWPAYNKWPSVIEEHCLYRKIDCILNGNEVDSVWHHFAVRKLDGFLPCTQKIVDALAARYTNLTVHISCGKWAVTRCL
jgi:hypothetical protein